MWKTVLQSHHCFQAIYIFDRIKELAPKHPEWKTEEPFASVLKGNVKEALAGGEEALLKMAMATHAGLTDDEFRGTVRDLLKKARHPKTGMPYDTMVFQPMLELLAYLRAEGFKTFIVSGGGIDFLRVFAEDVYGIPPEQVIGSSIKAGNSDGDFQMLEWTTSGKGTRFGLLVHHDDGEREFAYDRKSHIGKLEKGLDESPKRGWTIVSMKKDWEKIYPRSK